MAGEELWKGDRPPTRGELKHYLQNVLGIPDEDAQRLVTAYTDEPGAMQGQDAWTPESLAEYVDSLVQSWRSDTGESDQEASDRTANAQSQVAAEQQEDEQRDAEGAQARDAASTAVAEIRRSTYNRARARWVTDIDSQFNIAQSLASGVMVDANGNPVQDPVTGEPIPADSGTVFEAVKHAQFDMGRLSFDWPAHRGSGSIARDPRSIRDVSIRGIEGSVEDQARPMYAHRSADALAAGASREPGRLSRNRPPPRSRYVTPSQALNLLSTMSEDDLIALQQKMLDSGLYASVAGDGERALPDWGNTDPLTRRAFMELFVQASQRSGDSIDRVLADMTENHLARTDPEGVGAPDSGVSGAPPSLPAMLVDIPAFEPKVMSSETLGGMIDDLAQDALGQYVPKDVKDRYIKQAQDRELGLQRQAYDQSVADIRGQAGQQHMLETAEQQGRWRQDMSAATGGAGNDIDAFKAAISSTESGGNYTAANSVGAGHYGRYQISNANWPSWATRAGLGRNAPKTPENQEIVATKIMLDYHAQFGNWRDVAVAWFAGPGAVGRPGAENRSDGNLTVRQYADRAVQRMGQFRGAQPAPGSPPAAGGLNFTGGAIHDPIEQFDPQADLLAAIKAGDPLGFEAHEFAQRGIEWFSLLGGLV